MYTVIAILSVFCCQSFGIRPRRGILQAPVETCPCETVTSLQQRIDEIVEHNNQTAAESLHREGMIEELQSELGVLRHEIEHGVGDGEFDLNKMTLTEIAHFARGVHDDLKTLKNQQTSLTEKVEAMHEQVVHATDQVNHMQQAIGVRLIGAPTASEGRIELLHDGIWSTVCDDNFWYDEAVVVCNQLGFHFGAVPVLEGKYGEGAGPILLDNVDCFGNESSILDCRHNGLLNSDCVHAEDAGVMCNTEGSVRLVGGRSYGRGRVEILHNWKWGTICDDSWGDEDADVVCRQLGYSTGEAKDDAYFGEGTGHIYLDEVDCDGHERRLVDCDKTTFGKHNCGHEEDAGVICS